MKEEQERDMVEVVVRPQTAQEVGGVDASGRRRPPREPEKNKDKSRMQQAQRPPAVNQVDGIAMEGGEREDDQGTDQGAGKHENGGASDVDKQIDERVPKTAEMLGRGADGTGGGRQRHPP